jgi:ABC-type branched-subunit amino acid transport system ATPase component
MVLLLVVVAGSLASTAASALTAQHKPGKLEGCVYTRNNGATTTDFVKVFEKGAGHHKGTFTFNGEGVNATRRFTLAANGIAIVPVTVRTFGVATIVVHLANPPGSYAMQFTLSAGNDVTQSPCSP